VTEETKEHSEREHAPLGGSSAHRWANCTMSVVLSRDLPKEPASEAALEGTAAHEVAEIFLTRFLHYKLTGEDLPWHETTPELEAAAKDYIDVVWKSVLHEAITGKAYGLEDQFTLEAKLGMYGFIDFWAVYIDDRGKRVGVVVDFKYGFVEVEAEKNAQLAFYACAMREELTRAGKNLDYVRGVIFQPKVEPSYKEVKFTAKQLDTWRKKFFKAAEEIFVKEKPKYKVGDWCGFCPAKAICPKYVKEAQSKTALMLVDPEADLQSLPAPEKLNDEALAKIVLHGDMVEEFISACRKYALARARNGKRLPGTKLVEGSSRRKWKEDINEVARVLSANGVDPWEEKLIGLGEAEKAILNAVPGCTKKDAKELVSSLCDSTVAPILLVSEDDPRPKLSIGVDMLDVIE
jgi:hypothetical protein